jgi:hypothetical protein
MLVLVGIRQIDLTDSALNAVFEYFGEHSDFESPVTRDAIYACEMYVQREFPGEWISETVEIIEEGKMPEYFHKRPDHRDKEEPCRAAMHPVGHTAVITLTEFEPEIRIAERVAEPCQQPTVISDYIAVMKGDDFASILRYHLSQRDPDIAPFAILTD